MLDVITIGSAVLDIFVKSDRLINGRIEKDKAEAQELIMTSGGGATNNAVSFARKGLSVAPIIEMGSDPAAEMILSELKKESVNIQLAIQEDKETTAASIILLSPDGKSSILTFRGASRMLTSSDIPFDKLGFLLKPSGWIHLTSVGGDMELVGKIIGWAKEKRRKVFWNPGSSEIAGLEGDSLRKQGVSLISSVDTVQLNSSEAQKLFGSQIPHLPQTILIITNGAKGGDIYSQNTKYTYEGLPVEMIDSTGAGDAFGSGFISALLLGKPISQAVEWGRKQSASVVKFIGAKKGLLTIQQLINYSNTDSN